MEKDLQADYRQAGFGDRLEFGACPALVIIDFARAYVDPASPLYAGVESALSSTRRVLEKVRQSGIPVIFTRVEYVPGGADGGVFYRKAPVLKVFDRGSPLGAFAEGLEPGADEFVITKQYPSAFFGTQLATLLNSMRVDSLIITGVTTSGCVRATTLDAMQYGFAPFVVREAVGDRDPRPHEANLFDLQAKYAEVVSEAEIIAMMRRSNARRANQR